MVAFLSIVSKAFTKAIASFKATTIVVFISILALALIIYKFPIKKIYIGLIGISITIILVFVLLFYR
jgi:hypothetical protein